MRGERKFEAPFYYDNTARLIFSANKVPTVSKNEYAFFRRWIILTFPHQFEGESADKDLINKLITEEEFSGLFNITLEALKGLLKNNKFSYDLSVDDVENLYTVKSDNVAAFAKECIVMSVKDLEKHILYEAYVIWCQKNDEKPVKSNAFSGRFKKLGYNTFRVTSGDKPYVWEGIAVKLVS
jgi:putative DNA primase/helicase